MAKPRPVRGVKPGARLAPNARRILAVRIDEVFEHDRAVRDPAHVTELHDTRICFKRLRYLLEIFGIAFRADLEPFLEEVKAMQDLLGDIHDRDVQVPMLEEHLRWLEDREADAMQAVVAGAAARRRRAGPPVDEEAAFRRFRARLDGARRGDERPGVLALIARRRRERDELYARFLVEWEGLHESRFRERLEAAVGIRR
ncbi:MAG: CHAD domain-containing protein [Actinomycetota bacterium]